MDKLNKDYLLKELKIYLTRALMYSNQSNFDELLINYGKSKFIKDLLLRAYNFDLETAEDDFSKNLFHLFTEVYYLL